MVDVLALALSALDDADAIPVLADALLDGWDVPEAWALIERKQPFNYDEMIDDLDAWRLRALGAPDDRLPRAVVAVLLFGAWPRRWPLARENARREYDRMMREHEGAFEWRLPFSIHAPPPQPYIRVSLDDLDPRTTPKERP